MNHASVEAAVSLNFGKEKREKRKFFVVSQLTSGQKTALNSEVEVGGKGMEEAAACYLKNVTSKGLEAN